MSEYQFYEFRAIDRPLSEEQQKRVAALSSRARVTPQSASFVYNYGNFRGDPEQLMKECFDAMLYMSNWGTRRLMFRLPLPVIDVKEVEVYCVSEELNQIVTQEDVIIDLDFHDEEQAGWAEGAGWLDDLVGLREELIKGDYRVLYLAWLKAAEIAFISDNMPEPPVPPGLNQLSPALKAFISFLEIDEAMLAVAARKSGDIMQKQVHFEDLIAKMVIGEQRDFLRRLSEGEPHLSALFNRRLQQLAGEARTQQATTSVGQRTVSQLMLEAEEWRKRKREEERRSAERKRQSELEALAARETQVWKEVEMLIEERKPKSYDRAVDLLKDLRDLAGRQGNAEIFQTRITEMENAYSRRLSLINRMRQAGLMERMARK